MRMRLGARGCPEPDGFVGCPSWLFVIFPTHAWDSCLAGRVTISVGLVGVGTALFIRCDFPSSYVSLCDNEKTGCKARELKSVYVDAVGQFLKLIFHQNHANKYNIYNQVRPVCVRGFALTPQHTTPSTPSPHTSMSGLLRCPRTCTLLRAIV